MWNKATKLFSIEIVKTCRKATVPRYYCTCIHLESLPRDNTFQSTHHPNHNHILHPGSPRSYFRTRDLLGLLAGNTNLKTSHSFLSHLIRHTGNQGYSLFLPYLSKCWYNYCNVYQIKSSMQNKNNPSKLKKSSMEALHFNFVMRTYKTPRWTSTFVSNYWRHLIYATVGKFVVIWEISGSCVRIHNVISIWSPWCTSGAICVMLQWIRTF